MLFNGSMLLAHCRAHDPSHTPTKGRRWCAMRINLKARTIAVTTVAALIAGASALVVLPASPAYAADTPCQSGGVYIIFARGSTAKLGSADAYAFRDHIQYLLPNAAFAELGNLDKSRGDGQDPDGPGEYPA